MDKKYFFFDIDGTLAYGQPGQRIPPESAKIAVRRLQENGHFVAVATGRAYPNSVEFLNELGFEAEDFGGNSVVVRTAPSYVDYEDIPQLLVELIEQIAENKNKPASKKAEYAVYTIACKAAIKANHNMTQKELETLVEDVFKISPINTCPHGRPITIFMTKKEMEKEFKRIL